jgi:hypothetical protein
MAKETLKTKVINIEVRDTRTAYKVLIPKFLGNQTRRKMKTRILMIIFKQVLYKLVVMMPGRLNDGRSSGLPVPETRIIITYLLYHRID